ncbi:unnamed protein product [Mytilus coruscus]|uniref:Ig-like domain-containing protein n=1 Tax=Mytilus coruscus TaxID=42192 RepID=A0A6J8B380_MYTCO|nr:unnamed protein product [Mytilus coruscus]
MSGRGKGVRRKTKSSPYETQWDSNNPSNWTINKLKEELNKKGIRTPTGMSKLVLRQLYIENSSEGVTPIETQQTENFADNEINTDSPSESIVPITMAESVHQQRSSVSNGENENGGTDKNKTAESQNIAQCFAGLQETFKLLINRDNTHDKSREFNLQQWYDRAGIGNRSETYTSIRGNYQGQGNTENASFISGPQIGNFSCLVCSDEYSSVDIISPSIQKQIIDDDPAEPDREPVYEPSAGIEECIHVVFTCTGNVSKPQGKFRWVKYRRNSNGDILQTRPYESETTTALQMPGTCTFNGSSQLTLEMEQLDNNALVKCQVVCQDIPQSGVIIQTDRWHKCLFRTKNHNSVDSVRNVLVTKSPTNPSFVEGAGPKTLTCTSVENSAVVNTEYTLYKESNTSVLLGTGPTYVISNVKEFQYKYHCKQTFLSLSLNLCPIQPLYDIGTETRMILKLRSIRTGHRSAVSRLIKKFEDIQLEKNGTVDTEDLSNILDSLKRKQEVLRMLDGEIVQELDDGDIESEIVEADEYAFNLEGHHNLVDCKSIKSYRKDHKRHYTSLCKENTQIDNQDSVNVSTILHNAKESDTILHSQPTSGRKCLDANLIFDEGAHRSFITEDLAAKLQLSIIGTESLNLSEFGDSAESTRIRHLKTAIIYLLIVEVQLPIRVLIVPNMPHRSKLTSIKLQNYRIYQE